VRAFRVDAVVLGWSGSMVYVTWLDDQGRHLGWVPAADVERRWPVIRVSESSP
jgi:hypothetical protein